MKKYIMLLSLSLMNIITINAQRMLPQQKGLELNIGALPDGRFSENFFVNLGMTINGRKGNYQLWAVEYSQKNYHYKNELIPNETYIAEGGYSFYLLGNSKRSISFNTAIAGVVGYETLNQGEDLLDDGAKIINQDNFIYGAGGRVSLETYLSNRLVLIIQGKIKLLWGSDLEQLRPSTGVGLRFNF